MLDGFERYKSQGITTYEWHPQLKYDGVPSGAPLNESLSWAPLETHGNNTRNFSKLKREGKLIRHTAFNQKSVQCSPGIGSYSQTNTGGSVLSWDNCGWLSTDLHNTSIMHNPDTAYASAAVQNAAAAIMSEGWDALTFASELPKLKDMFQKSARKIVKLAKLPRKQGFRGWRQLGDAWLEGRYGWRTLAYDIRDLDDAIRNYDKNRLIWTERQGYNDSYSATGSETWNWAAGDLLLDWQDDTEHSIRGSVAAEIQPARFQVDPLQTGWELVPYSFVVDWVLNVGQALAATKLLALSKATTASIGIKSVSTRIANGTAGGTNSGFTHLSWNESYYSRVEQVTRNPTVIPVRPLLTGRAATADLLLDLRALANFRNNRRLRV